MALRGGSGQKLNERDLLDLYGLETLYSTEEKLVRDAVREFVRAEMLPNVGDWWQTQYFPKDLPLQLGRLGVLGATLPEGVGGSGASALAYGLIARELEYGDAALRSFLSVQTGLVIWPIFTYGSSQAKSQWIAPLVSGEAIGCFGLSEPDAGSDPGAMRTQVRAVGDEYVITGVKRWITNASIANVAVIWARGLDDNRVHGFIVDTTTPGFSTVDIKSKASMRIGVTSEVYLDEVVVPKHSKLEVSGLGAALSCLNQARFGIVWGAIGAASYCFLEAVRYAGDRNVFGGALAGKQIVQERLADMLAEITKANLLAFHLAGLRDKGLDTAERVSLAKRESVRAASKVARNARDLLGGNGITTEYGAMRHMANLETEATYEGTDTVHTLVLGKSITGISAF